MSKIKRVNLRFGELLYHLYEDIYHETATEEYLPTSDLAYITSLLNNKFNKNYSFDEVKKLLKEEGIS